jgi:hypothetical protein
MHPCAHVVDLLAGQLAALDAQLAELARLRDTVARAYRAYRAYRAAAGPEILPNATRAASAAMGDGPLLVVVPDFD